MDEKWNVFDSVQVCDLYGQLSYLFQTDTVYSETTSHSLIVGNPLKAKNQSLYCSPLTIKIEMEENGTTCNNEASRVLWAVKINGTKMDPFPPIDLFFFCLFLGAGFNYSIFLIPFSFLIFSFPLPSLHIVMEHKT